MKMYIFAGAAVILVIAGVAFLVKGKKKGTAKITVTCNGVKKVFTVKVK